MLIIESNLLLKIDELRIWEFFYEFVKLSTNLIGFVTNFENKLRIDF